MAYDPETGIVTRLVNTGGQPAGAVVGYFGKDGYPRVGVRGRSLLLHRVAWMIHTGEQPPDEIDHRDGDKANLRWLNLRPADRNINNQNRQRAHANNALGILGVTRTANGRFVARIRVNTRGKHLGIFDTPEAASEAYMAARRALHQGNTL